MSGLHNLSIGTRIFAMSPYSFGFHISLRSFHVFDMYPRILIFISCSSWKDAKKKNKHMNVKPILRFYSESCFTPDLGDDFFTDFSQTDRKSSQIPKTLLIILADFSSAAIYIVSLLLVSCSSSLFTGLFFYYSTVIVSTTTVLQDFSLVL